MGKALMWRVRCKIKMCRVPPVKSCTSESWRVAILLGLCTDDSLQLGNNLKTVCPATLHRQLLQGVQQVVSGHSPSCAHHVLILLVVAMTDSELLTNSGVC